MTKERKLYNLMENPYIGIDLYDPDLVTKISKCLGLKKDETYMLEIPQFSRIDGKIVSDGSDIDFDALLDMSEEELEELGCFYWGREPSDIDPEIWLYPEEWLGNIPEGIEIVDIYGKRETFEHEKVDGNVRFGALSYGFYRNE